MPPNTTIFITTIRHFPAGLSALVAGLGRARRPTRWRHEAAEDRRGTASVHVHIQLSICNAYPPARPPACTRMCLEVPLHACMNDACMQQITLEVTQQVLSLALIRCVALGRARICVCVMLRSACPKPKKTGREGPRVLQNKKKHTAEKAHGQLLHAAGTRSIFLSMRASHNSLTLQHVCVQKDVIWSAHTRVPSYAYAACVRSFMHPYRNVWLARPPGCHAGNLDVPV